MQPEAKAEAKAEAKPFSGQARDLCPQSAFEVEDSHR